MRRRLVTVLLAVIAAILAFPAGAAAQGSETLGGTLENPDRSKPVEGIEITVSKGEEEIGSDTTDSEGNWEVDLPGPGDYTAVLDPETLPEDFVAEREELQANVRDGQQRVVIFQLALPGQAGQESPSASEAPSSEETAATDAAEQDAAGGGDTAPGVSAGTPFGTKVIQLAVAGVIFGLIIAISSIGLSLIFGTTGMINFAHGEMVTFGAMMALLFSTGSVSLAIPLLVAGGLAVGVGILCGSGGRGPRLSQRALVWTQVALMVLGAVLAAVMGSMQLLPAVPLVVAAVLAIALGGLFGAGVERFIWQPLRRRNVALIQMFIVSIGLALLMRYLLLVFFGGSRMRYQEYQLQEMLQWGPVGITPRDLTIVLASLLVLVLVGLMLQFTRIGKAMRAVSDNRDLAESSGIDVNRVTLYVWSLGGALSALGGVFYGLNQTVYWQMGFHLLLLMFAGVILGGLGTAYGAMVGGLVIGLVAMLSTLWFPVELQKAWALGILIIVLLVRPQGILGRRERVG